MDCNDKQSQHTCKTSSMVFSTLWKGKLAAFRQKKLTVTLNAGLWRLLRFYGPPNMCVYDYNGAADRCEIAKCVCVKPRSIVYLFTSWHKSSKLQSYISSLSNEPHVYQTRMIALVVMSQPHNERGGVKWRENESRNMTASSLQERGS